MWVCVVTHDAHFYSTYYVCYLYVSTDEGDEETAEDD